MKIGRVARFTAWGIVGLAGLVIPCVTLADTSARHQESEIAERVATLRGLELVKDYAFRLAGIVRAGPHVPSREDFAQRFSLLEESVPPGSSHRVHLERIGAAVRALETAVATEDDSGGGISGGRLQELAALLASSDALESHVRDEFGASFKELQSRRFYLNLLALLSCALAVTLALLLFAYDRSVMDRRKAEEGEHELKRELAHVGRLSVVGELGTKIAHEVNQPLGAIQSYVAGSVRRLRQRDGDPKEVIGALEQAMRETERASAIIRGLREFARQSEGRFATAEINELVREVLPLLSAELRESRIDPELELAEGLDPVHADRIQIEQVLVNLIKNSIEAMAGTPEHERRLIVRTSRASDRWIEVEVEDTGCGLPTEVLPNLFQPFHTTKAKGMGIGLAISRTIVEAHEGTIRAEPRRGRGAVFRFQLPCPSMVVTA